jgi:glycosyltransferase involved in cell wall biosynthesis
VTRLPVAVATGPRVDPLVTAERQSRVLMAFGLRLGVSGRVDLIHAHTGVPDGIASIALADQLGVPLVVTEHDRSLLGRLQIDAVRTAYLGLIGQGRRLVAVSESLRQSLAAALQVSPDVIHLVPNAVDVDAFEAIGAGGRDPDELLWVGGRKANKGTDVLLAAFRDLRTERPSLRLRLIGSAPDHVEEARLRGLARDLGVQDAVAFEPPADRAGVAAAMMRAAAFVHPSPYETFGVVAAEALAAGLPVAATPSDGVPEILGLDGACGSIATGFDAAALAAAVRDVLVRREGFDPDGLRARVVERYAPSVVAQKLLDLYADVLARPATVANVPRSSPGAAQECGPLPLIVGLHRPSAHVRIDAIPHPMAAEIVAVTSVQRPGAVPSVPAGPSHWIEVDPERAYNQARSAAGAPVRRRTGLVRILRAARNPFKVVRLRRLAARRGELVRLGAHDVLREVLAKLTAGGQTIEILPLDADDATLVEPFLSDGIRFYPSTLRGMVDRWDAAGGPAVQRAEWTRGEDPR